MPVLLAVHHTSSPSLADRLDSARYVHGNLDTTRAVRAVESRAQGMGRRKVHEPVTVIDKPGKGDRDACRDLGATVATTLVS